MVLLLLTLMMLQSYVQRALTILIWVQVTARLVNILGFLWYMHELSTTLFNGYSFQAKVRARLSRPHQRGRGKHISRDGFRSGHGSGRVVRGSWGRPVPHGFSSRGIRGISSRAPPPSLKRPVGLRDRRPIMSAPTKVRPLAPPLLDPTTEEHQVCLNSIRCLPKFLNWLS